MSITVMDRTTYYHWQNTKKEEFEKLDGDLPTTFISNLNLPSSVFFQRNGCVCAYLKGQRKLGILSEVNKRRRWGSWLLAMEARWVVMDRSLRLFYGVCIQVFLQVSIFFKFKKKKSFLWRFDCWFWFYFPLTVEARNFRAVPCDFNYLEFNELGENGRRWIWISCPALPDPQAHFNIIKSFIIIIYFEI